LEINDVYRKTFINLDYYHKNTNKKHIQLVRKHYQEDLSENRSITKLTELFTENNLKYTFEGHTLGTKQEIQTTEESQVQPSQETTQNQEETSNTKHAYMH